MRHLAPLGPPMQIEQLLAQRADLWRGRGLPAAEPEGQPTGFAALDAALPWRGWPRGSVRADGEKRFLARPRGAPRP